MLMLPTLVTHACTFIKFVLVVELQFLQDWVDDFPISVDDFSFVLLFHFYLHILQLWSTLSFIAYIMLFQFIVLFAALFDYNIYKL